MDQLLKFVVLAVCAGAGGFLGSYLRKKGENLATHEDIEMLVTQVRAVTAATKEIEAKISGDLWDRQKRWELKREALFEATRAMALLKDKLTSFHSFLQTEKDSVSKGNPPRLDLEVRESGAWNETANNFERATALVGLTCGKDVSRHLQSFNGFARGITIKMMDGHPEAFVSSMSELVERMDAIETTMRKEIGIDELTQPEFGQELI